MSRKSQPSMVIYEAWKRKLAEAVETMPAPVVVDAADPGRSMREAEWGGLTVPKEKGTAPPGAVTIGRRIESWQDETKHPRKRGRR